MAEKNLCSVNCFGCHFASGWRGWHGQPEEANTQSTLPKSNGASTTACITPACLKSVLACGSRCHPKKLGWFYGVVLIMAILSLAAVPLMLYLRGAGPGRFCDDWETQYMKGPCWMSLVDVKAPKHWTDILSMTGSSLAVVAAVAGICAAVWHIRKLLYVASALLLVACACQFAACTTMEVIKDSSGIRAMMTDQMAYDLKKQLRDTFFTYQYDLMVKKAWDNINIQNCCCGVDGFEDWQDSEKAIPETCDCQYGIDDRRASSYYIVKKMHCPSRERDHYGWDCNAVEDPATSRNITQKGCVDTLYQKMAYNFESVVNVFGFVLLGFASAQFLFGVILPLIGLGCCCQKKSMMKHTNRSNGINNIYQESQQADTETFTVGSVNNDDDDVECIDVTDTKPIV